MHLYQANPFHCLQVLDYPVRYRDKCVVSLFMCSNPLSAMRCNTIFFIHIWCERNSMWNEWSNFAFGHPVQLSVSWSVLPSGYRRFVFKRRSTRFYRSAFRIYFFYAFIALRILSQFKISSSFICSWVSGYIFCSDKEDWGLSEGNAVWESWIKPSARPSHWLCEYFVCVKFYKKHSLFSERLKYIYLS